MDSKYSRIDVFLHVLSPNPNSFFYLIDWKIENHAAALCFHNGWVSIVNPKGDDRSSTLMQIKMSHEGTFTGTEGGE